MIVTENQIFAMVIATINAGLIARKVENVTVQQWYQRRTIGAPKGMALLLSNVATHRHGFLGSYDRTEDDVKEHLEVQANEVRLQCTGQSTPQPPPKPLPPYTAGDLAKLAATILSSDAGRQRLQLGGLGIERITDVRQPYFQDEKGQFEAVPSFDFVLALNQTEKTEIPFVTKDTLEIYRV